MLEVANLYLTTDDLDACQHQLMTLLKNEKENDAATIVSQSQNYDTLYIYTCTVELVQSDT
jgi:hypothetical protein